MGVTGLATRERGSRAGPGQACSLDLYDGQCDCPKPLKGLCAGPSLNKQSQETPRGNFPCPQLQTELEREAAITKYLPW